MKFLSICSGIEAASVAWAPLGWKAAAFSEIESFPSAVLAHHYPDVPNLGDMLILPERILAGEAPAPDLLCGGTPCQAFSVAGNRRSLDDARGNLSLTFCEIANAIDAVRAGRGEPSCIVFWENVPGVLNTPDNAFGCFLAGIAGETEPLVAAGGKWTNAGCVYGPKRAVAWRVLDAQYFGVAQRRRRVFLVASARDGFDPSEILFERAGVRRDLAPSREARQEVAGTIAARFGGGGQPTGDVTVIGNVEGGAATTLSSREYKGLSCGRDGMTSAAVVYEPIALAENTIGRQPMNGGNGNGFTIAGPMYTLNATGVHGVAQPIPLDLRNASRDPEKHDAVNRQGVGVGEAGDPAHTVTSAFVHGVAQPVYELHSQDSRVSELKDVCGTVSSAYGMGGGNIPVTVQPIVLMDQGGSVMNVMEDGTVGTLRRETHGHEPVVMQPIGFTRCDYGGDAVVDCTPTMRCGSNYSAHLAVAQPIGLDEQQNAMVDCFGTLLARTEGGGFQGTVMQTNMAVRRLTPVECERLQGFPDNYTNIPWRKQPTSPDGPRYKALGNSWAVPNVRWIGARIDNYLKQLSGEQK